MASDQLRESLDRIASLIDEVGPESDPYKPKYEAVRWLEALLEQLGINESEYTLDLQAVLYALRGKIAAETDEPTAAIDFLFTAVVYFVARFQNADIIKSLNIHSLFSGAPSFLSFQPPVKTEKRFTQFWSFFADSYNDYLKLANVLHPETHQAACTHEKLMANLKDTDESSHPELDPTDPSAAYATTLVDGLGSMDLDAPTQNPTEPDAAFITEVTSAVEEIDDVKHAKPPKFGMEETLLKLSCVGDCAGAPAMTTTIQIQLLPFYVLALNYLGVIWANRENRKLALNILKSAESAMCLFDYDDPFLITEPLNDGDGKELHTHMLYLPNSAHPFFQRSCSDKLSFILPVCSSKMISSLNTYTIYFLAQVYGEDSPCQSAEYCGMTISRQYKQRALNPDFDPQDFIINCLTLQKYYTTNNIFKPSFTLIDVAEEVLFEYGPKERAQYVKDLPANENMPEDDVAYLQSRARQKVESVAVVRSILSLDTAREVLAQIRTERARLYSQILSNSYQRRELLLEARREQMKIQYTSSEDLSNDDKELAHKQIRAVCQISQDECVSSVRELYDLLLAPDLEATLEAAAKRQLRKLGLQTKGDVDPESETDEKSGEKVTTPKLQNLFLAEPLVRTLFYDSYRQFIAASRYFILDGFVTDHCQILLDISTLHQIYAYYEEARLDFLTNSATSEEAEKVSYTPLIKLHTRRCTTLEKVIPELSLDHYSKLIASLQVEVAEARTAIYHIVSRDIACNPYLKRLTEDMEYAAQLQLKQIDPLPDKDSVLISTVAAHCSRAIEAWRAVCKTYETDSRARLLQEYHFKRKEFSKDEIMKFLTFDDRDSMQTCIFETAKLLSQLPTCDPVIKHGLLADSLRCFEQVQKLWLDNENLHKKETSLKLIGTTIDLLREKIGRVANVIADYHLGSSDAKDQS